jgi:hypothetical protein
LFAGLGIGASQSFAISLYFTRTILPVMQIKKREAVNENDARATVARPTAMTGTLAG